MARADLTGVLIVHRAQQRDAVRKMTQPSESRHARGDEILRKLLIPLLMPCLPFLGLVTEVGVGSSSTSRASQVFAAYE
jgi:hypothetical protein